MPSTKTEPTRRGQSETDGKLGPGGWSGKATPRWWHLSCGQKREGESITESWENSAPGRGDHRCKGPGVGRGETSVGAGV